MAIYDDLTRGYDHDVALEKIDRILPDWATGDDPSREMLALILLDEHYELRRSDDYVYITPGFAWAIMPYRILEPTVARLAPGDERVELTEGEVAAATERASREPFEVKLSYSPALSEEDEAPSDEALPEELRGQTIRVRIMTDTDAERLPAMLTVRADGTPITLPTDRLPGHVG